jgi:hypothetical protein
VASAPTLFQGFNHIANILIGDYEQELSVKLRNTGVGPLIVESFIASVGNQEKDDITSWMPETPKGIYWSTFIDNIDGWCISPNQEVVIIRLSGKSTDEKIASFRNDVRRTLSQLTATLKYKDIYDRRMPIKQRELKWFSRHFAPEILQSNEKA